MLHRLVDLSLWTLALLVAQGAAQSYTAAPTVALASGTIIGVATQLPSAAAGVNQFLGVPFAQSPPERFSPPQAVQPWTTPKNTTAFTAACIQQFNYPEASRNFTMAVFNAPPGPPPAESEDCLYLNVYAPNTPPPPGGRPVMFWLYGGANQFGTAMQHGYDGTGFASYQDVIVVAINYRTNIFGFSSSPAIPVAERNVGFLDQNFALQWVQDNIASFGGDPTKVTIFGESAGAVGVDRLITTSPIAPKFRAAIMESGQSSIGALLGVDPSIPVASWNAVAQNLSCTGDDAAILSCVRAADALQLKSIIEHGALSFAPIADNVTSLQDPSAARAAGNIAKVPIMIGSNAQEGRVFEFGQNNLTAFLSSTFGNNTAFIEQIQQLYPQTPGLSDYDVISQIYTDLIFTCPIPLYTKATTAINIPSWRYYYNASFVNTQPLAASGINLGVFHSSEIALVFGTYPDIATTAQEAALQQYMQGAWAQFAHNPTLGPGWPAIGQFNGSDVGALGTNGTSGVTMFDSADVDKACNLFAQLYSSQ